MLIKYLNTYKGPKCSKGTLRPDFQTYTRPRIFTANVTTHHKIHVGDRQEIQV
jgi:hypothetical protein